MPAPPLAATLLAAARLMAQVIGGRTLDAALAAAKLSAEIRPAAMDHAYGALRRYGRGDFLLACLLRQPLKDPVLRGLLLAALARLEARPDEAHTTVDQAVAAAGRVAGGHYRGLVNGVLRSFLRRQAELIERADGDDEARWQHPAWWLGKLRQAHPGAWREIAEAGNGRPPMTLRVNRRRGDAAAYAAELAAAGIAARAVDDTAVRLDRPLPVERLPGFAEGRVSVQDWGAQQAAPLLAAGDGMRVLDACAAPGGKTAHLLERADVAVTAIDADGIRAGRIRDNLARLGLAAELRVADCRDTAAWWDGRPFERILADVPCSASGVARRHPDIKWLRRPEDIDGFARTQAEIVDALWRVLAPGGTMLYATCSVFAEENEAQVAAFAARHADARIGPAGENAGHFLPDAEHDGFFYALLEKR
jgi:16S rRNA (cytosine967-C5)-methyltransferase